MSPKKVFEAELRRTFSSPPFGWKREKGGRKKSFSNWYAKAVGGGYSRRSRERRGEGHSKKFYVHRLSPMGVGGGESPEERKAEESAMTSKNNFLPLWAQGASARLSLWRAFVAGREGEGKEMKFPPTNSVDYCSR